MWADIHHARIATPEVLAQLETVAAKRRQIEALKREVSQVAETLPAVWEKDS